jgi:Flp pilus assembly protein TadD
VGYWILGNAYLDAGNLDAAVKSYESSIQIAPDFEEPNYQLGYVLIRQGKFEAAEVPLRAALQLKQDNADAHACLGFTLINQRKYSEGAAEYSNALALRPNDQKFSQALALATVKAESESALTNFSEMLKKQPTPEIHVQIAAILTIQGRFQEAVEHYLAALQLKPDSADVLNNLAWLLATCPDTQVRDGTQAVKHAERACELTHYGETMMVGTLAAAYAEAGRFDEAISTAQKACTLATESGQPELLKKNQELLELYRQHKPYRDGASSGTIDQTTTNRVPDNLSQ